MPGQGLPQTATSYHRRFIWSRNNSIITEKRITVPSPRTGCIATDMIAITSDWKPVAVANRPVFVYVDRDMLKARLQSSEVCDSTVEHKL